MKHRVKRLGALVVMSTVGIVGGWSAAPAVHAVDCDAATFTIDGQFDQDGYLACLAGTTSTPKQSAPGASIVVVLSGFTPGEKVTITVNPSGSTTNAGGTVSATGIADSTGTVRVSVKMPSAVGTYVVTGTGVTSGKTNSASVLVSAAGGGGGTPLPSTGSDSTRLGAIGLGLLVLGAGTVVGARRRRHALTA